MRRWLIGFWLWLAMGSGCQNDHGSLARSPGSGGKAGASARGGSPQIGGAGEGDGGFPNLSEGGKNSSGTGGSTSQEPEGESTLTFVHGIVDAGSVRVCFAERSGSDWGFSGRPEPETGLEYGRPFVLRGLDAIDSGVEGIQPLVIAGDLELIAGLDCAAAVERARAIQAASAAPSGSAGAAGDGAGGANDSLGTGGVAGSADAEEAAGAGGVSPTEPPALRLGVLPLVPRQNLTSGRSLLFVANGCIGGPAFVHRLARSACGDGYSARTPTLNGVLVPMSRQTKSGVTGFQVVHASVATAEIDVRATPPEIGLIQPVWIANDVDFGVIAPRVPDLSTSSSGYGTSSQLWQLQVLDQRGISVAVSWSAALAASGLEAVEDGNSYVLAVIGPRLDLTASGFWNLPLISIVPSDP